MKNLAQPSWRDRFLIAYYRRNWRGLHALMRVNRMRSLRMQTAPGAVFDLQPWEYIDGIILHEGFYEPEVLEALRPFLGEGAVLWDIGANFGLQAISAACLAPATRVFAFEPNPATFTRLQNHARLNQVDVSVQPMALGEREGEASLYVNDDGNSGMSSLMHASTGPATTVRVVRGDTLIDAGKIPAPTAIKLDVEGGEEFVLRGLGRHLTSPTLRAVVYETNAQLLERPAACAATRELIAAGFKITALPRAASQAHLLANFLASRS